MRIETVTDFEDFKKLGKEWSFLLERSGSETVFLRHEWFSSWWEAFGEGRGLFILAGREGRGNLVGLAPLMNTGGRLFFMANEEVTDYCDFIVDEKDREEYFSCFFHHLKGRSRLSPPLTLINMREASPNRALFSAQAQAHGLRCLSEEVEVAPILDLPEGYDEYLESLRRKDRHELRRKLRRLNGIEGLKVFRIKQAEKMPETVGRFISLHKKTVGGKRRFWEKEGMERFFRSLASRLSDKGRVEFWAASAGEKWIAVLMVFSESETVYFYNMAYDPEFAEYSPGFTLFNEAIRQAIVQKKKSVDFLRGSERYKYYFGARNSRIYRMTIKPEEDRG